MAEGAGRAGEWRVDVNSVDVHIKAETEAFDEWVRSLRLLVSQIGFALDGYLASRPSPSDDEAAS